MSTPDGGLAPHVGGIVAPPRFGSVILDVDSTLSAVEGVDWLASLRGPQVAAEVEAMTERAMNGSVSLEEVYAARLALVKPTRLEVVALSAEYVARVQEGARALCARLHLVGCDVIMLSGGLRDALLPLAEHLGVHRHDVYAVEVDYDERGVYTGLRGEQPLAGQQGKPRVLHGMLASLERPAVMIGDGSTDAATRGIVDAFIAYTGVVRRPGVVAVADAEAPDFATLHTLLFDGPGALR